MAYSDYDSLLKCISEAELIQLTDDAGAGVVDQDIVAEAIEAADEEIDSYLATVASVPLDPVPGLVAALSADIAIWNLCARRGDACPEVREKRYDASVKKLERISKGIMSLGQDDPRGNPPDQGGVSYHSADPVMTDEKLAQF